MKRLILVLGLAGMLAGGVSKSGPVSAQNDSRPRPGATTAPASKPNCQDVAVVPGKAHHGPYGLIFVGIPAGTFRMGLFGDDGDRRGILFC